MRASLAAVIVILVVSPTVFGQGVVLNETLMHGGAERDFILYVPPSYSADQAAPLVLTFHSRSGNANQMMLTTGMNAVAEQEGFLVAYPDSPGGWGENSSDNNLGFTDALLETIQADYTVDSSRIYANGLSNGGVMSYLLGVSRPNTFAAIASVSGTRAGFGPSNLFPSFVDNLPERPVPLLHMHGTADAIIPYDGGFVQIPGIGNVPFPSTPAIIGDWAANNGCGDLGPETMLDNIYSDDESTVSVFTYQNCSTFVGVSGEEITADVLHYRVNSGGHAWPVLEADREASIAAVIEALGEDLVAAGGATNSDINASAEIWNFFSGHELAASGVPGPALQAGDADMDLDFDQLDLVQVQVAAKYLSGQPATWGEGDWDGAPGGAPGSPPVGDGVFNQLDIVAAQQAGLYLAGPYASVQANSLAPVPEPSGLLLLGVGFLAVACRRCRVRMVR